MAKTKTNKKGMSDKVRGQKKDSGPRTNPFEVKINKQKHSILGRKVAKYDKGKPGVSRSRAIQKRKDTLLQEYKQRGKSNKFVDRRIGEGDTEMSVEDKMLQRFALEKQKYHEKSSLFNLNEDEGEELTHFGQSLSEIEKFEDPVDSDSEDDIDGGKITAKIVEEEHFGGFLTRKKEEEPGVKKSWKERMEEVIAQSKKHKYERQNEKEKMVQMTEKVDLEWKELRMALGGSKKPDKTEATAAKKKDDYDVMVRELQFEIKGNPSDRLKTEEELAKEESEKLQKRESDRLRRMKGITEEEEQRSKHKSADDLDDDFLLDPAERFEVMYKDGKLVTGKDGDDDDDDEDDEEEEDEDDDDDSEESEGDSSEGGEEEGEEEEGEEDDEDAMGQTSDLESEEEDEHVDEAETEKKKKKGEKKRVSFTFNIKEAPKPALTGEALKAMLKEKKEMMEAARKELPYTFKAPETYEDLLEVFEGHSEGIQLTVLERLIKCHHPSLAEGNKEKLERLFTFLVQYFGDLAVQDPPVLSLMDRLTRPLYDLTQMSKVIAGQTMVEVIKEKQQEFNQQCERRGGRGTFPTLDLLMYLKLISVLFPTSDFKHHVVTPALLFMSQIVTQCPVTGPQDIASGLFVCNLFLEYVSFSKRLVPEAINFLSGLLFLAVPKDPQKLDSVIPPFKPVGSNIDLLRLKGKEKETRKLGTRPLILSEVYSTAGREYMRSDAFRIHSLSQCLKLLHKFSVLYEDCPCYVELFEPVGHFLSRLQTGGYPPLIKDLSARISEQLEKKTIEPRRWLVRQKQRPRPLKQFEPQIEEVFDGKKKRTGSKEVNEKQRLVHKVKKEQKGAVREIKRDVQFLARQKLQERLDRDAERKRKVNRIYQDLARQEGDFKAMKRQKERL